MYRLRRLLLRSRLLLLAITCLLFLLLTLTSNSSSSSGGGGSLRALNLWLALSLFRSQSDTEALDTTAATPILGPDCDALASGNQAEVKFIQEMLYKEARRLSTDEDYMRSTRICNQFISERGYPQTVATETERQFPIAYILTVHRSSEQVERLLRAIYMPHNVYCIHMDQKSPQSFQRAIAAIAECLPNVFVSSQQVEVVYAGFSRLEADLLCMRDLLNVSSVAWKYVINLCGQDHPLRTNLEIVNALKDLHGKNDIAGVTPMQKHLRHRFKYEHKVIVRDGVKVMANTHKMLAPPPNDTHIYFGNAYNLFTREFVHFVLHDAFAQELLTWMKSVYSPDEFYWTTLQYRPGTPGGSSTPSWSSVARAIKWEMMAPKMYPECQGRYQRQICVYGVGDLEWLVSRTALFANKFDLDGDHVVVGCLESMLSERLAQELQLQALMKNTSVPQSFSILTNISGMPAHDPGLS